jgi:hypothetical protein
VVVGRGWGHNYPCWGAGRSAEYQAHTQTRVLYPNSCTCDMAHYVVAPALTAVHHKVDMRIFCCSIIAPQVPSHSAAGAGGTAAGSRL